jgi:hypothetical protein
MHGEHQLHVARPETAIALCNVLRVVLPRVQDDLHRQGRRAAGGQERRLSVVAVAIGVLCCMA